MNERRISVRGIIFKDGKIFAQKFRTDNNGETDYWGTPGGGLDPSESLDAGLTREMVEETGMLPVIGKLLFIQQFSYKTREQMEFFFHIENASDYENVDLTKTTHGMQELTRCEFIDPAKENILPEFLQTIDVQDYIANDKPVYVANYLEQ